MVPFFRGPRYAVILGGGAGTATAAAASTAKESGMDYALNGEPFVHCNFVSASNLMDAALNGEPFVLLGDMEDLG